MSSDPLPVRGWRRLALITLTGIVIWCGVLPWVGQQASVRQWIERNERLGIDPTAMYYTELENMHVQQGLLKRIKAASTTSTSSAGPSGAASR